ncbi:hypothetical protein T36_2219 (plasmid) [Helicobacter cinaedi]|uniref:BspA family leucine-rich repeat surface protein n=1 Tax=Helicobacter cinaedi TaxID=213 RepID=UPI001F3DE901|nr:BspA family leucine-rich repeat surface protein [Helicobacter cinaedi]BDB65740.1 hypothetical protein T36_2219 [Helicobacter cinaedi]
MKYKPQTKEELKELVKDESIHLGDIDTTHITNMSSLFEDSTRNDFSGIEKWNVSNVKYMTSMFAGATNFNQPLDSWDTSNVKNMSCMFYNAKNFNQPLDSWDTSNVENMSCMFYNAKNFNQPLDSWNTSKVENMICMFQNAKSFNQPLDSWNTSNVENMSNMFNGAESFNQDISSWSINEYCYTDLIFDDCLISEENKPQALQENIEKSKSTKIRRIK